MKLRLSSWGRLVFASSDANRQGGAAAKMTVFFCPHLSTSASCTVTAVAADRGTASRVPAVFSLLQSNICSIYALSFKPMVVCGCYVWVLRKWLAAGCASPAVLDSLATL